MRLRKTEKTNVCASFIEAINNSEKIKNAERAFLYGNHRNKLDFVNFLLLVNGREFLQNSYAAASDIAEEQGLSGAVNVRENSEFSDDFSHIGDFMPADSSLFYTINEYKKNEKDELQLVNG